MDILAMIKLCINTIANAVLMPGPNMGYLVFLFVIYAQYKRTVRLQEYVYGQPKTTMKSLLLTSILSGLVAGIFISIPMTLLGITFNQDMGIGYLIILSLILMIIEPRFVCFSYSGGLLSIVGLIFGLKNIDPTGIMMLVAILHMLEAVLIFIDGHRGAVPVFLQKEDGSVIGGFTMQRFWPIPMALALFSGYGSEIAGGVATPGWWPLIQPSGLDGSRFAEALFVVASVSAILGYSEFTSSRLPREKCRDTSYKLALFSIVLFTLSFVSSYVYIFKYIAALFGPIAHEVLIEREKRLEKKRDSIFATVDDGIKVLDTLPQSPAETMGIQPGDTVISINNSVVTSSSEVEEHFKNYIAYIWVDVRDRKGNLRTLEYSNYKEGIEGLGVLMIPENTGDLAVVKEQKSFLRRLFDRFKKLQP